MSDDDLLRAVLDNLLKTETKKYDLSLAVKHSIDERRRILREEQRIVVCQIKDSYEIVPMKRMRNSFGSIDEMTRTVPPAEFLRRGGEIIRDLFSQIP